MSMPGLPMHGREDDPPPWLVRRRRRSTRARIIRFALLGGGAVAIVLGTTVGWLLNATEPPSPWDGFPGFRVRVTDERSMVRYSLIATLFLAPGLFLLFALAASVQAGLKGMGRS